MYILYNEIWSYLSSFIPSNTLHVPSNIPTFQSHVCLFFSLIWWVDGWVGLSVHLFYLISITSITHQVHLVLPVCVWVGPSPGVWQKSTSGYIFLPEAIHIHCQQLLSEGWDLEIIYPIYIGVDLGFCDLIQVICKQSRLLWVPECDCHVLDRGKLP